RLAAAHQVEGVVDVGEGEHVGDEIVDVDLAVHVPVDDLGHVAAALGAPKGRALPHPTGDELERARADLLARASDADDHRGAPALVTALERLTHDVDVADALEREVGAAAGELDEVGHELTSGQLAGV